MRLLIGLAAGAVLGYGWYLVVGCPTGGCPITSTPWGSMLYGAALGGLVAGG